MDRYHVLLAACLALQAIFSLATAMVWRRRLAEFSSTMTETRNLVMALRDQNGRDGT